MGKMIRNFLLLFLLVLKLFAGNIAFDIEKLNKEIPYATKGQTVEILHQLENLYIQAVISKERSLIVKSLKGIIRSRQLLGLDASSYQKEYQSLTKSSVSVQTHQPKRVQKTKTHTSAKRVKKSENSTRRVVDLSYKDNTVILKFDKKLKGSELISFRDDDPKSSLYQTIYNIKATYDKSPKYLNTKLRRVKVQSKGGVTRVLLQNPTPIYSKAFIRGGNLFIKINNALEKKSKKSLAKSTTIVVQHQPKEKKSVVKYSKKSKKEEKKIALNSKPISTSALYATSKIIVIDPGHGGKDSGAVGYKNHYEKKAVLKVAKYLKRMLESKGYKVYMTRDSDRFVSLKSRTHMATKLNADLFISIHANAAPKGKKLSMKGIETFFLSPARTDRAKRVAAKENMAASSLDRRSQDEVLGVLNHTKIVQSHKLAIDLQSGLLEATRKKFRKVRDGGVREAPFWVLVGAQMPAALVEIGYITNPMEGDRLYNPFYQKALAKGIYNGINNYFAKNR